MIDLGRLKIIERENAADLRAMVARWHEEDAARRRAWVLWNGTLALIVLACLGIILWKISS